MRRWLAAHGSSGLEERAKDRERVERHVCVRAAGIVASVRDSVWRGGGGCLAAVCGGGAWLACLGEPWARAGRRMYVPQKEHVVR